MVGIFRTRRLNIKTIALTLIKWVFIICVIYLILFPIIEKGIESVKGYNDLMDRTVNYVPKTPTLKNFTDAMEAMKFNVSFKNSVILSLLVSVIQVFACTIISYGFARFNFPFKNVLQAFVIITLLIPPQTIMSAQFFQFRFFDVFGIISAINGTPLNLLDSLAPFVMLSATGFGLKNGLYIYLMTQFLKGIPKELEEAGYVDGANSFHIFVSIILPAARTMMFSIFLFSFSWQWTDTYYTRLFLSQWLTLPSSVANVANVNQNLDPATIRAMFCAATMLILTPIGALYFFTQNYFIEGLEKSGIVG